MSDSIATRFKVSIRVLRALRNPVRRQLAIDVLTAPVVTTFSLSADEQAGVIRHCAGLVVRTGDEDLREPMATALLKANEQLEQAIVIANVEGINEWETGLLEGAVPIG